MIEIPLIAEIEAKDEYVTDPGADEWGPGAEPGPEEAATRLTDVLADVTKHDELTGWRVLRVRPVPDAETRVALAEDTAQEIARAVAVALDALDLTATERLEANQAIAVALYRAAE